MRLKQIPEDFIVEEIDSEGQILEQNKKYKFMENSKGKFLHCILIKKELTTIEAVMQLAKILKIDHRRITFAGTKDKHAITSQKISLMDVEKERLNGVDFEAFKIIPLCYSSSKVFLGNLEGNRFAINVRNIDQTKERLSDNINQKISRMNGKFANYFGEQRFGTGKDATTHLIGKSIIMKKYSEAIKIYERLELTNQEALIRLKQLPHALRKLFVHAYQSYLFNKLLEKVIELKIKVEKLPLIGYDYKPLTKKEYSNLVEDILNEEKISIEQFKIDDIPDISCKTEMRAAFQNFYGFSILKIEKDELNKGKLKCLLQFTLPKSTYATVFLKELFSF